MDYEVVRRYDGWCGCADRWWDYRGLRLGDAEALVHEDRALTLPAPT